MKHKTIKITDRDSIQPFLNKFNLPKPNSHKGQNGRVLIIGGSSLFHSASIWAAEVASHIVDIVHYSSTQENNEILLSLKEKFHNGIVIPQEHLPEYIKEDDAILVGPGMVRGEKISNLKSQISNFEDILKIADEPTYTYLLTKYLIENFPEKKFVFDAGALQMMDKEWLTKLKVPAIITPHQKEFEELFGINVLEKEREEKVKIVQETAAKYKCVILLKAVYDVVSDGKNTEVIEGGNQGLTKGGTGDVLAGLAVSFYAKNDPIIAATVASYVLKTVASSLMATDGVWYNLDKIIESIPRLLQSLFFDRI